MTHGADQEFLRMASHQHVGMIERVHAAMHRAASPSDVRLEAREIDRTQQEVLRRMTMLLKREFEDRHQPTVTPEDQRMIARVRQAQSAAADRAFYETVIEHGHEGVRMIGGVRTMGEHLEPPTHPEVRRMAERMRDAQQREIGELQQKLASRSGS